MSLLVGAAFRCEGNVVYLEFAAWQTPLVAASVTFIVRLIPTLVYPGQGLGNKGIILFRFILLHAYITVKAKVNFLYQSVGLSVGSRRKALVLRRTVIWWPADSDLAAGGQ